MNKNASFDIFRLLLQTDERLAKLSSNLADRYLKDFSGTESPEFIRGLSVGFVEACNLTESTRKVEVNGQKLTISMLMMAVQLRDKIPHIDIETGRPFNA